MHQPESDTGADRQLCRIWLYGIKTPAPAGAVRPPLPPLSTTYGRGRRLRPPDDGPCAYLEIISGERQGDDYRSCSSRAETSR
jgi:hypothetical protein